MARARRHGGLQGMGPSPSNYEDLMVSGGTQGSNDTIDSSDT